MIAAWVVGLVLAAREPPAKLELAGAEAWYRNQKAKEETFVGVLEKLPLPPGAVGFGRINPFQLVLEDGKAKKEIYLGARGALLAPYAGKKVKLTGKAVEMEVEGKQHHEVWPARLEVVRADDKPDKKPEAGSGEGEEAGKLLAQGPWTGPRPRQMVVFHSAKDVMKTFSPSGGGAPPGSGENAETELAKGLGKMLKFDKLDFKKHMLVLVSLPPGAKGRGVKVTDATVKDKKLVVQWKETETATPAVLAVFPQFEGEVTFDPPPAGAK
jgi:hypothetical protein